MRKLIGLIAACVALGAGAAMADEVGKVGVDWVGNDIMIDAIKDPKVDGVTCHVAYFDRSIIDRLHKGNWFEDPSDSSISCRQTGPITIGDIDMSERGEEVFKQGLSLIWKKTGGEPHLRQEERDADLSLAFAPGPERLSEDVGHDRAALWPERRVGQGQAAMMIGPACRGNRSGVKPRHGPS